MNVSENVCCGCCCTNVLIVDVKDDGGTTNVNADVGDTIVVNATATNSSDRRLVTTRRDPIIMLFIFRYFGLTCVICSPCEN